MDRVFPTIAIFREAVSLPFRHGTDILISLGLGVVAVVAAIIAAVIATLIGTFVFGMDTSGLVDLQQRMANGNFSGLGAIFLIVVVAVFTALIFFAHIFNYWVTLAAYGAANAKWSFSEGRGHAAAANALKLLLISILITIINAVVIMFLSTLGLAPSFAEQMANTDVSDSLLSGATSNIIGIVVGAAVYSTFSANLTQTAVMSKGEGLEHPHVVDFAIVLVLLYAVYLVPTLLAALSGSDGLVYVVSFALTLHLMFTVPISHGLRFSFCTQAPTSSNPDSDGPSVNM